jgi:hypothetical protein
VEGKEIAMNPKKKCNTPEAVRQIAEAATTKPKLRPRSQQRRA